MKKIVCLWGGPGTGKSTTCAGVFNILKKAGFNTEMNREYIKEWVWEGRTLNEGDQVYITAKTLKKEAHYIRKGVEFIVTDSPAALTTFYGNIYDKYEREFGACRLIVKQHHQLCKDYGYKIEHYFLVRTKPYQPEGRLKAFLEDYGIKVKTILCDEHVEQSIVNDLLKDVE